MYGFSELTIDDINKFEKGQGYAVTKFQSKADKQIPLVMQRILCKGFGLGVLKVAPILTPLERALLALA